MDKEVHQAFMGRAKVRNKFLKWKIEENQLGDVRKHNYLVEAFNI